MIKHIPVEVVRDHQFLTRSTCECASAGACTFSTSQLPKGVRTSLALPFDFQMPFTPQPRALFVWAAQLPKALQHCGPFYIWYRNVLCATAACNLYTQCFATFLPYLFAHFDLLSSESCSSDCASSLALTSKLPSIMLQLVLQHLMTQLLVVSSRDNSAQHQAEPPEAPPEPVPEPTPTVQKRRWGKEGKEGKEEGKEEAGAAG